MKLSFPDQEKLESLILKPVRHICHHHIPYGATLFVKDKKQDQER